MTVRHGSTLIGKVRMANEYRIARLEKTLRDVRAVKEEGSLNVHLLGGLIFIVAVYFGGVLAASGLSLLSKFALHAISLASQAGQPFAGSIDSGLIARNSAHVHGFIIFIMYIFIFWKSIQTYFLYRRCANFHNFEKKCSAKIAHLKNPASL